MSFVPLHRKQRGFVFAGGLTSLYPSMGPLRVFCTVNFTGTNRRCAWSYRTCVTVFTQADTFDDGPCCVRTRYAAAFLRAAEVLYFARWLACSRRAFAVCTPWPDRFGGIPVATPIDCVRCKATATPHAHVQVVRLLQFSLQVSAWTHRTSSSSSVSHPNDITLHTGASNLRVNRNLAPWRMSK
jgi:hypothetical protein